MADYATIADARVAVKNFNDQARSLLEDDSVPGPEKVARMTDLAKRAAEAKSAQQRMTNAVLLQQGGQSLDSGAEEGGVTQAKTLRGTIGGMPPAYLSPTAIEKAFNAARAGTPVIMQATRKSSGLGISSELPASMPLGIAPLPIRLEPTRVSQLFPSSAVGTQLLEVLRHNSTTGSAGPTPEGTTKPSIDLGITKDSLALVKIAASTTTSTEALTDLREFGTFLSHEMVALLIQAENDLLLNGSTIAGASMTGMIDQAGLSRQGAAGAVGFDVLSEAFNDVRQGSAFTEPNFVLMSPGTYDALRRTKDQYGRYLLPETTGPSASAPLQVWGVPIKLTTAMRPGEALLGNSTLGGQVFFREGVSVRQNAGEHFTENLVSWIVEERVCAYVPYADALAHVTGLGAVAWAATTAYELGTLTIVSGDVLRCTTAGSSGSTAPTPPASVGGTVTDGTVVWTRTA